MIHQQDQKPLLWESDEESHFACPRQHRSLYYRNSKSKIKGAAFIIKNWPDHISSLLEYWWIGFIMIAITIFIIYNSISIIDVVTPSRLPFAAAVSTTDNNIINVDEKSRMNIYMHIFVESYDEINDEFYLKYVKKLAKEFTHYKYNIIVILNDGVKSTESMNYDIKNNNNALRTVLKTDKLYKSEYWSDISIQYILLSKYLDSSPIKDLWNNLPTYTIPFLIRCISIWDKGGIAFDPIIITPLLGNPEYSKKLYNTLKKYTGSKMKLKGYKLKDKPKVNNIQDIIRILENDETKRVNIPQYNLSEAENKEASSFTDINVSKEIENKQYKREAIKNSVPSTEKIYSTVKSPETEYLKNTKLFHELEEPLGKTDNIETKLNLINSDDLMMQVNASKYTPKLSIELKGNIIATSTSCHAFIGTVFSNIKHYRENHTIENIITDELSIFCKGNISSCKYIDII